jgi:hypothetical protein
VAAAAAGLQHQSARDDGELTEEEAAGLLRQRKASVFSAALLEAEALERDGRLKEAAEVEAALTPNLPSAARWAARGARAKLCGAGGRGGGGGGAPSGRLSNSSRRRRRHGWWAWRAVAAAASGLL